MTLCTYCELSVGEKRRDPPFKVRLERSERCERCGMRWQVESALVDNSVALDDLQGYGAPAGRAADEGPADADLGEGYERIADHIAQALAERGDDGGWSLLSVVFANHDKLESVPHWALADEVYAVFREDGGRMLLVPAGEVEP